MSRQLSGGEGAMTVEELETSQIGSVDLVRSGSSMQSMDGAARLPDLTTGRLALGGMLVCLVWGLMHMGLGLAMLNSAVASPALASESEAESLMFFVCATVLGLLCCLIAVTLNRRNSRTGFWLNVVLTVPVDVALIILLVEPGHVDVVGGLAGPLVMAIAIALSASARVRAHGGSRFR